MKRKSNFHSDLLNFDSIDLISFLLNKFLFNAFPVAQNNKIRWFFQAGWELVDIGKKLFNK